MKRTTVSIILWLSMACVLAAQAPVKPVVKVQCAGITKTGQQCKRMVKPPAVYCYQHKDQGAAKTKRFDVPGCTTDTDCEKKYGPAYRE